jgi:hypothetical protein
MKFREAQRNADRKFDRVAYVPLWGLPQILKPPKCVGLSLLRLPTILPSWRRSAAGAIMPGVASSINVIFSQVNSIRVTAASS